MNKDELRGLIDEVDSQLLVLLNRRASLVIELWKLKKEQNLPMYDQKREERVRESASEANQGPLTTSAVINLFNNIIEQSRLVATERLDLETPNLDSRQ
jgi:chorismate mutase